MNVITEHIEQIRSLCDKSKVRSLFAFGCVVTDKFRSDSDIDLLVDIAADDPLEYSDNYFYLKFTLEKLLNRKIDLVEKSAMTNPYFINELNRTKVLVY